MRGPIYIVTSWYASPSTDEGYVTTLECWFADRELAHAKAVEWNAADIQVLADGRMREKHFEVVQVRPG